MDSSCFQSTFWEIGSKVERLASLTCSLRDFEIRPISPVLLLRRAFSLYLWAAVYSLSGSSGSTPSNTKKRPLPYFLCCQRLSLFFCNQPMSYKTLQAFVISAPTMVSAANTGGIIQYSSLPCVVDARLLNCTPKVGHRPT